MANMILGAYTFASNPSDLGDVIGKKKSCATQQTYSSVAFFSWGLFVSGVEVELSWDYMSCDQFDALDNLYQADAAVVWDPQDGSSKTYNVEVTDLVGRYHIGIPHSDDYERRDVRMRLLILSEV
jgi:hypothetical protein